jgi:hypothetical protein
MSTYEMVQAERELDARIDYALRLGHEVAAEVDSAEQTLGENEPVTDADVSRMKAFILGCARTPEWELVIGRIDEGELTWRLVLEQMTTDRDVAAAFESLSKVPPVSMEILIQNGVFPGDLPDELSAPEPRSQGRRRAIMQWPSHPV